jgi:hypothetical protein
MTTTQSDLEMASANLVEERGPCPSGIEDFPTRVVTGIGRNDRTE